MGENELSNREWAAFMYAYKVLKWCEGEGISASVEMFPDGSGNLIIPFQVLREKKAGYYMPTDQYLTSQQKECLEGFLHSDRWEGETNREVLRSCGGWYEGWEPGSAVGVCEFFHPISGTCRKLGMMEGGQIRCGEHRTLVER